MVSRPATSSGAGPDCSAREDGQLLDELYRAHGEALCRFLLRWTRGEPRTAEELARQTLVRAAKSLDQFDRDRFDRDPATLRPWLFTIARRIAVDAGRARSAEVGSGDVVAGAGEATRPDAQVTRRALLGLLPEHRAVIVELYYQGRSVSDTARRLGIPEATVASRTYHALRALRRAIDATTGR